MRYVWVFVVLTGAVGVSGCSEGVLDPRGPISVAERQILFNATGVMLAIVIPTMLATLGVALWFRASNRRAQYQPEFQYSGRIELLVWSIPLMTILLVGSVGWMGAYDLDPPKPIASSAKSLKIEVVSLDWKWLFIYPDEGIASVNQVTIPVGAPVTFELTSSGVMNSFFVPQLGGQIYTMAGMTTNLNLQADYPGVYRGISANFSGDGFADMHFNVVAVPPERFARWVEVPPAAPVRRLMREHMPAWSNRARRSRRSPMGRSTRAYLSALSAQDRNRMGMPASAVPNPRGWRHESPGQAELERNSPRSADHHGHCGLPGRYYSGDVDVDHSERILALSLARVAHFRGP